MSGGASPDDLVRAFDFILRADMAGTRTEPFRWGTAVFLPECPLRHDSNCLLVRDLPEGADAEDGPKDLYRRLGFDEIGRYVEFTRTRCAPPRLPGAGE